MENQLPIIPEKFGNKVRVRVSGLCIQNGRVLLAKHKSVGSQGILWAPPGGGLEFGETLEQALQREFEEETGLKIKVGQFLFINEYFERPLHAIELFFEVHVVSGTMQKGNDPELPADQQILQEVAFIDFENITGSPQFYHSLFTGLQSLNEVFTLPRILSNVQSK